MQRCTIWTVSLAAALSLTGAAWADHEGGGGHGPAASHGTTPTFAKRGSDEARESHSGAQHSEGHSAANFAARLANNPTLSGTLLTVMSKIPGLCASSTCTTAELMSAASGFRNQGQFIAALHAAKDLAADSKITFAQLKSEMTGSDHDSLGQAIHELDPALPAQTIKTDVTNARQEAKADLQAGGAAKEAAEDAKESAKEKAEDAKEAAKEKAEDAKEAEEGGANFAARLTARLANDPTLAATLNGLLPTGTNVQAAAMGFRNLNQFLTALNAAKDLAMDPNISFAKLKGEMTGSDHDSLAQAIHELDPALSAQTIKTAIMTARNDTKADLKAVRAAEDAAEDAKEATKEAAEDAKEATKEAAEEANEAAKAPTGTTTGTSATSKP